MFKISPEFKDYLWGGTKLKTAYGKNTDLEIVAESWELSTHKDGIGTIWIDENCHMKLDEYIKEKGKAVLGEKSKTTDELPILIKLIDAKNKLSIQVHPDDAYAIKHEGDLGKTEMWYVVDCEEDSELIYGFKQDLTKEQFKKAIEENTILEVAKRVKVKPGDTFFITPGTMHAIGSGILIAEIQESSNVTYRISDYGRLGADGKPRALHIEKSLEVTNLTKTNEPQVQYIFNEHEGYRCAKLSECEYFNVTLLEVNKNIQLVTTKESFHAVLVLEGNLVFQDNHKMVKVVKGETIFIPANYGAYTINGEGKCILTTL